MLDQSPRFFTLADGRRLCFQEYGDAAGHPVIYAHGAPSCRLEASIYHESAQRLGLRIIAPDRPGFGQSDFLPGRRWTDYLSDIDQLTAHLNISNFGHIGWSAGGPPTLVAAYRIPQRLDFAISLAGQPGLDNPEDVKLLAKADQTAVSFLHLSPLFFRSFFGLMSAMEKLVPNKFLNTFIKSSGPDDARILSKPEVGAWFNQIMAESFRQGGKGVSWDAEIDYSNLGFRAEDVTFPVHIFQGDEDTYVTHALQKQYADRMPNAVWHGLPGRGHFFPVEMAEEIMALARELLDR